MRFAVAVVCVMGICVSAALPAPTRGGRTVTPMPRPRPGAGLLQAARPDLVVRSATVYRTGWLMSWHVALTVANIGTQRSDATKTGLVFLRVSPSNADAPVVAEVDVPQPDVPGAYYITVLGTPSLAPGEETTVVFSYPRGGSEYILATADFPTSDHPLGAVRESSEGNNVLVVPLIRPVETWNPRGMTFE